MIVRIMPQNVPDFFDKYEDRLRRECYVLAENGHGTQIKLTSDCGLVKIRALNEGFMVASVTVDPEDDVAGEVSNMYDMFLGTEWRLIGLDAENDDEDAAALSELDEAYERTDAVRLAFYDFLCTVVEDEELIYDGSFDVVFDDIMNDVLQRVSDCGLPVRFPVVLDDDDGGCSIEEYPYERDLE